MDDIKTLVKKVKRRINDFCRIHFSTAYRKIKKFNVHAMFVKRSFKDFFMLRYIVRELVVYFLVMYLFFFLIFFVNQILLMMQNLLGKNLPFMDVALLCFYSFPAIMAQTAPFATLTGFLMALGRMHSDNEILILRASGQDPKRVILQPVVVLGLIISLFSFFLNDYLLPVSIIKYKEQYLISISRNPLVEIESNTVKKFNSETIVTGEVKGNIISDVVFFDRDAEGNQRIINALESTIDSPKLSGVSMQLNMNDSTLTLINNRKKENFEYITASRITMNIFESAFMDYSGGVEPNEMTSTDILKEIRTLKKQESTPENVSVLNKYKIEFNKKYSLSFGALFFAFLAVPLALLFGKTNGQFVGLVIGVLISVLYWALMWVFMLFGYRNGFNGFFAMWMPNIIVGIAGGAFFYALQKQ